jgi:7,8-dihydropterin-6-yl-methyl-4-(beta-D-ribofuranosyl)aminobenzene 5'-phosphate synthase
MNVTVLTENSPGPIAGLEAEFGLSLLIETPAATILMDTGASGRFAENAEKLGIDLASVDWLVLSHGHYDHGGGLGAFFEKNGHARAVIKRGADSSFYGSLIPRLPGFLHRTGAVTRYIGLDSRTLERYPDRIQWIDADTDFAPGVRVLASIPHIHPLAKGNDYLLVKQDGRYEPDDFHHELLLVIEQECGSVVFSGCAHNGILNMLEAVRRANPDHPICAVIGGFHLNLPRSEKMSGTEKEIRELAESMGKQVAGKILTGHCTGAEAFSVLKSELGEQLQALHTGDRFII